MKQPLDTVISVTVVEKDVYKRQDFIIAHRNKVVHQRMPYLIQKLTECQKYRFFDVLQINFVLCDHELESQKETVINWIVAYHGYKGFGLVVYLLDCDLTELSSDQLL